MTDLRLVYLIGEPGVGKTTLMRSATADLVRGLLPGDPARELLARRDGRPVAVELGRSRGTFSGTDALPMNAVVVAERHVLHQAEQEAPVLLAEGARLANARFLSAAVGADWRTTLVHVVGPAVAAARREERGTHQDPAWVKGAATRARRLAEDPPAGVDVVELDVEAESLDRMTARVRELAGLDAGPRRLAWDEPAPGGLMESFVADSEADAPPRG